MGRIMYRSSDELSAVLTRVANRDAAAFEDLYRATSAKLYGIIVRVVANRSSADEILQEVYVRVWQHAGDFDATKASPITWMATIARNRAIDEVRRSKPGPALTLTDSVEVASDEPHPLDSMDRSEELQALIGCLNMLDEEKRNIILLAYYRGLSREELAQRFGRPVPTIKTWLHRGLAQLKACLS